MLSQSAVKKRMPKGAVTLYFTQLFSTLSFSVLYSTLVLYATHALHLDDNIATSLIGTFVAFNYALHLLGGYAGGRYLSYRALFVTGMILITIGCGLIALGSINSLYWGLALFLTGAGVNVTCINCMLTQLFEPNDTRREKAFLLNYSGMNIGFLVGFTIAGYYQIHQNYSSLFLLSSLGNILALIIVAFNWNSLKDINTHLSNCSHPGRHRIKAFSIMIALIIGLRWMFAHAQFSSAVVIWIGVIMAFILITITIRQPKADVRHKLWAYLILSVASLIFWALYQLIPMGLTLFIARNVARTVLGVSIPPQWFENINAILIIIFGPLLAMTFSKLRARGRQISIPLQFGLALILIGSAMLVLTAGIYFANAQGFVAMGWPIGCYVLLTCGELFISPIGYAMIGQLAPAKLRGILMGTWLMLNGVGATISSYASHQMLGQNNLISPILTNPGFSRSFALLGSIAISAGIFMFILVPMLNKLIRSNSASM